ncbi:hypothetical protein L2E82_21258 [Cichorium intybus]|uniref:Uncharacterized protein n=1 Tax=Cichorium intybus TaxID=13427 RepID=A0ACB9DVJ4_CICIN|nr:hypothetical protein L2E82_21258 [Cichorium intybus]
MSSSSNNNHGRMIVDIDQEPPLLCDENVHPPCHCKFLAKCRESWKNEFQNEDRSAEISRLEKKVEMQKKKKRLEDERKRNITDKEMTKKLENMQEEVSLFKKLFLYSQSGSSSCDVMVVVE